MLVKSSLEAVNKMIGGYPTKIPVGLYGRTMVGKTIFAIQEATKIASELGGNVLYIGTEGGEELFINEWLPSFNERFGCNVKFSLLQARNIVSLLRLHGFEIELRITGKIDVRLLGQCENVINKVISNNSKNIKVVVYDSITNPLKTAFPSERINYPARASALNMLMNSIHDIAINNDVAVLMIHHASFDPTLTKGQAGGVLRPRIASGDAITYNTKILLCLIQTSTKITNLRKIYLVRYFNKPEWSESAFVEIRDDGFWDVVK
ncbi:MAG: AAA family ATPase [Candidatus Odinarchaeia archaeon]